MHAMRPHFAEALATQRREQLLADAAGSHRTRTMRATRRIWSPRSRWSRARLWFWSSSQPRREQSKAPMNAAC